MAEYRIVRDSFNGYEVQARRWWFPVWLQCGFTNSHSSIEKAEQYAEMHAGGCVKYLGRLEPDTPAPFTEEMTMDPRFPEFMMAELRQLLSELENAQEPSNVVLAELVTTELRRQYDKANKRQCRVV